MKLSKPTIISGLLFISLVVNLVLASAVMGKHYVGKPGPGRNNAQEVSLRFVKDIPAEQRAKIDPLIKKNHKALTKKNKEIRVHYDTVFKLLQQEPMDKQKLKEALIQYRALQNEAREIALPTIVDVAALLPVKERLRLIGRKP